MNELAIGIEKVAKHRHSGDIRDEYLDVISSSHEILWDYVRRPEGDLTQIRDAGVREQVQRLVEMKRRHLQALEALASDDGGQAEEQPQEKPAELHPAPAH